MWLVGRLQQCFDLESSRVKFPSTQQQNGETTTIARLLARAKDERDWPTIALLKATADLIRWTMANAETLKVAAAVVRDPAVQAVLSAFPGLAIKAIRSRNDEG
jgi:hypothetical protein